MANKKYSYYIMKNYNIIPDLCFSKFKDAIPTLNHYKNIMKKTDSMIAIIKGTSEQEATSRVSKIDFDDKSDSYICVLFGSHNGMLMGPYDLDLGRSSLDKYCSMYAGNHCEFIGLIQSTNKQHKRILDKINYI